MVSKEAWAPNATALTKKSKSGSTFKGAVSRKGDPGMRAYIYIYTYIYIYIYILLVFIGIYSVFRGSVDHGGRGGGGVHMYRV